jgi:hypothetical protein
MFLLHSIAITLAATSEHAPFNQSHCPLFLDSFSFLLVQDNDRSWSPAVQSSCKIQGSAKQVGAFGLTVQKWKTTRPKA